MKLRYKDRVRLEKALMDLIKAQDFLMQKDILVCRVKDMATTTLDYTNAQGQVCTSVDKEIGIDLCFLHSAVAKLFQALKVESPLI
jgi:hypothetical protein